MGKGPANEGKRAFFFQCLGRYFDMAIQTFKWGVHPDGPCWNFGGEQGVNCDVNTFLEDLTSMAYLNSTYGPYYQSQALDYLLELHSPQTTRTLEALKDSHVLESILNADRPAARTCAKCKFGLGETENIEHDEVNGSQHNPTEIN